MSRLGQTRSFDGAGSPSGFPPKAEIGEAAKSAMWALSNDDLWGAAALFDRARRRDFLSAACLQLTSRVHHAAETVIVVDRIV
jgi:hypothetical protein